MKKLPRMAVHLSSSLPSWENQCGVISFLFYWNLDQFSFRGFPLIPTVNCFQLCLSLLQVEYWGDSLRSGPSGGWGRGWGPCRRWCRSCWWRWGGRRGPDSCWCTTGVWPQAGTHPDCSWAWESPQGRRTREVWAGCAALKGWLEGRLVWVSTRTFPHLQRTEWLPQSPCRSQGTRCSLHTCRSPHCPGLPGTAWRGWSCSPVSAKTIRSGLTLRSRRRSYVDIDSLHWEDLHLVLHGGHEPEELLAIFVPVDWVQPGLLQVKVTTQPGGLAEDQLVRHLQTSHCQRPTACNKQNKKAQTEQICLLMVRRLWLPAISDIRTVI